MLTLADYTRPLRSFIPLYAISDEAFERILAVSSYFPTTLANRSFIFEIFLCEDRVDLSLLFRAKNDSQQQLLQLSAFNHPIWQKVARFASLWRESTSLLHLDTDNVWLSFDLDQPIFALPIPSIFYCSVSIRDSRTDPLPTIQALVDIFRRPEEVSQLTASLARCLERIPEDAQVNQVGFGLLRSCSTVRLQILNFSAEQIPAYLGAIGWAYPTEPLYPFLEQFALGGMLSLMIDVSTGVHPRIGLECILQGNDSHWRTAVDYLVERGLCQPDKRDFLVGPPWVKLCQVGRQVSLTRQGLSHIKIGYHPEQTTAPFEAKAYVSYYPGWLPTTADEASEEGSLGALRTNRL